MSQTLKKVKAKERGKTRSLVRKQRELARAEKESERELPPGKLSRTEEIFARSFNEYRNFHRQKKYEKIIKKAKEKINTLERNKFYVRIPFYGSKIQKITMLNENVRFSSFELLYIGKYPSESYYIEFSEDEVEEENNQVRIVYRVYEGPPFLFFIMDFLSELTPEEQFDFLIKYGSVSNGIITNPFYFLMSAIPEFKNAYEKEIIKEGIARQKLEHLREKGLEAAMKQTEERTGKYIGENVEAKLRSFLSPRPHARNYSGISSNFQKINTNLFE